MGSIALPPKALLFTGLLFNRSVNRSELYNVLEEEYGPIILQSDPFPFTETGYYRDEMGEEIWRVWTGFDALIEQDSIVEAKLRSNELEQELFSIEGRRNANIDTGYVTCGKVVLATTKNNQHRVYLQQGIYAEVTLRYRSKTYMPWEWTYPDYRRGEAIRFFNELRGLYREKLLIENC